jgi:hypothetical protein
VAAGGTRNESRCRGRVGQRHPQFEGARREERKPETGTTNGLTSDSNRKVVYACSQNEYRRGSGIRWRRSSSVADWSCRRCKVPSRVARRTEMVAVEVASYGRRPRSIKKSPRTALHLRLANCWIGTASSGGASQMLRASAHGWKAVARARRRGGQEVQSCGACSLLQAADPTSRNPLPDRGVHAITLFTGTYALNLGS